MYPQMKLLWTDEYKHASKLFQLDIFSCVHG